MRALPPPALEWLCVALVALCGCEGKIVERPGAPVTAPADELVTPTPDSNHGALGLRRLAAAEYVNTVRDLLGVDAGALAVPTASLVFGLSDDQHVQQVSRGDLDTFIADADALSTAALGRLALPSGCTAAAFSVECFDRWAPAYLKLAYRRPPTADELSRQRALFQSVQADDGSQEALRAVLQASLLSPSFLYRFELPDGTGALDGYAVASRLSYLAWSSAPDAALLAQAERGGLFTPEGLGATLDLLLLDPRAEDGALHFVSEWLGTQTQLSLKGVDVLAGLDLPTLQGDLEAEQRATVRAALLAPGGSLQTLLTARWGYVSPNGAKILGLAPVSVLTRVDLSTQPRRGILTSPLLIAAHAKESGFSVVQLGRFVRERLVCQMMPPPPPGTDTTLPPDTGPAPTTYRAKLTAKTSGQPCTACHQLINPPGFAYLGFDPVGRFHPQDVTGVAFDSSGTFSGLSAPLDFTDAPSLIDGLAPTREVQACFARRTLEHAFGRTIDPSDAALYRSLVGVLSQPSGGYHAFLGALVTAPEFSRAGPLDP